MKCIPPVLRVVRLMRMAQVFEAIKLVGGSIATEMNAIVV
jgi:hypothetical protein